VHEGEELTMEAVLAHDAEYLAMQVWFGAFGDPEDELLEWDDPRVPDDLFAEALGASCGAM
jgi:hypothetical protein